MAILILSLVAAGAAWWEGSNPFAWFLIAFFGFGIWGSINGAFD